MSIELFIASQSEAWLQELLIHTDQRIKDLVPHVVGSIKWQIPCYHYKTNLCYLNPKPNHLDLGFMKGILLSNEQGLLVGNGKQVRYLQLRSLEDVYAPSTEAIILEAALLNE